MASAFSVKNYLKKIYSPDILVEYYKRHGITAIFEITESTPRKTAVSILVDFYNSLSPEQKIEIQQDFILLNSISTKHIPHIIYSVLKDKKIPTVTEIECVSDHDKVLYYFIYNTEVFEAARFFHSFYASRGYMIYEAKEIPLLEADLKMTSFTKECTRIANKEDNATECEYEHSILDGLLFFTMTFDSTLVLSESKEVSSKRRKEVLRIVYLPSDKEILISYTGSKHEKLIFLDTFLRTVCLDGYTGKIESFDISHFSDNDFDFRKTNKGTPLLTWKIKAATLSFGGNEKTKKKIKLLIPSSPQEHGLAPLYGALDELGVSSIIKTCKIENVSLVFSFTNAQKPDKSILVSCSVSKVKSSLCPLFPYDRLARTLLKQAGIEQGFVEDVKKEKNDEVAKKWDL